MSCLGEATACVDTVTEEGIIAHMNKLLITPSDDTELSRENRYTQQQRLHTAIVHYGRKYKGDVEVCHEWLTRGSTIL